ncbi:hypothetical protein [Nocardioides salsibiostraticola]
MGDNLDVVAVLGDLNGTGDFVALGSGQGAAVPSAVEVTASVVVDRSFLPGSGGAVRSAVGANEKTACFQLGSYAAAIKTGNSALLAPLNGLLGLNLQAVSYQGLATGTLSVDELVATGQVGTTDQLVGGQVTLGQLYNASLTALQNQGPTASVSNAAAIAGVQALIAQNVDLNSQVSLSDVLSIDTDDSAALATQFNVLDVLTGAALVANGTNAIALTGITAGLGGVGGITVNNLSLIERARLACGIVPGNPGAALATCATASSPLPRGCAQNSQVRGSATIPLTIPNLVPGFAVTATSQLTLDLGNASGVLNVPEPTCVQGTLSDPDTLNVLVNTSLATASLSTQLKLKQILVVPLLLTSVRVVIEFDVAVTSGIPNTTGNSNAALAVPPNDVTPVSGGSDAILSAPVVGSASNISIKIDNNNDGIGDVAISTLNAASQLLVNVAIGGLVNTAFNQVTSAVVPNVISPLISSINTQVLDPISKLLGLDIAGADVYGVGRPTCQTPKLVG